MYAVYVCFVVYVCNYIAVAKTCQKPYAKTPQKTHKNFSNMSKNSAKTFTGHINGFNLGGLQMIPDHIMGKKFTELDAEEWISFICLLHTKCLNLEDENKKLKTINKKLTKKS